MSQPQAPSSPAQPPSPIIPATSPTSPSPLTIDQNIDSSSPENTFTIPSPPMGDPASPTGEEGAAGSPISMTSIGSRGSGGRMGGGRRRTGPSIASPRSSGGVGGSGEGGGSPYRNGGRSRDEGKKRVVSLRVEGGWDVKSDDSPTLGVKGLGLDLDLGPLGVSTSCPSVVHTREAVHGEPGESNARGMQEARVDNAKIGCPSNPPQLLSEQPNVDHQEHQDHPTTLEMTHPTHPTPGTGQVIINKQTDMQVEVVTSPVTPISPSDCRDWSRRESVESVESAPSMEKDGDVVALEAASGHEGKGEEVGKGVVSKGQTTDEGAATGTATSLQLDLEGDSQAKKEKEQPEPRTKQANGAEAPSILCREDTATPRPLQASKSASAIADVLAETPSPPKTLPTSQSAPHSLGKSTGMIKSSSFASIIESLKQVYVTNIHTALIPVGHHSNQAERQVVFHRTASESNGKRRASASTQGQSIRKESMESSTHSGLRRSESVKSGLSDMLSAEMLSGSVSTRAGDSIILTPQIGSDPKDIPYWIKNLPSAGSGKGKEHTSPVFTSPFIKRNKSPAKLTSWDDDVDEDVAGVAACTWNGFGDGYDGSWAMLHGRSPKSSWSEELSSIAHQHAEQIEKDTQEAQYDTLNLLAQQQSQGEEADDVDEEEQASRPDSQADTDQACSERGKVHEGEYEHLEYGSSHEERPGSPDEDVYSMFAEYKDKENHQPSNGSGDHSRPRRNSEPVLPSYVPAVEPLMMDLRALGIMTAEDNDAASTPTAVYLPSSAYPLRPMYACCHIINMAANAVYIDPLKLPWHPVFPRVALVAEVDFNQAFDYIQRQAEEREMEAFHYSRHDLYLWYKQTFRNRKAEPGSSHALILALLQVGLGQTLGEPESTTLASLQGDATSICVLPAGVCRLHILEIAEAGGYTQRTVGHYSAADESYDGDASSVHAAQVADDDDSDDSFESTQDTESDMSVESLPGGDTPSTSPPRIPSEDKGKARAPAEPHEVDQPAIEVHVSEVEEENPEEPDEVPRPSSALPITDTCFSVFPRVMGLASKHLSCTTEAVLLHPDVEQALAYAQVSCGDFQDAMFEVQQLDEQAMSVHHTRRWSYPSPYWRAFKYLDAMDHMSPFSRARHVNNLPYYLRGLIYLLMLCCNWDMDQPEDFVRAAGKCTDRWYHDPYKPDAPKEGQSAKDKIHQPRPRGVDTEDELTEYLRMQELQIGTSSTVWNQEA